MALMSTSAALDHLRSTPRLNLPAVTGGSHEPGVIAVLPQAGATQARHGVKVESAFTQLDRHKAGEPSGTARQLVRQERRSRMAGRVMPGIAEVIDRLADPSRCFRLAFARSERLDDRVHLGPALPSWCHEVRMGLPAGVILTSERSVIYQQSQLPHSSQEIPTEPLIGRSLT